MLSVDFRLVLSCLLCVCICADLRLGLFCAAACYVCRFQTWRLLRVHIFDLCCRLLCFPGAALIRFLDPGTTRRTTFTTGRSTATTGNGTARVKKSRTWKATALTIPSSSRTTPTNSWGITSATHRLPRNPSSSTRLTWPHTSLQWYVANSTHRFCLFSVQAVLSDCKSLVAQLQN